jgi:hypothetical protein
MVPLGCKEIANPPTPALLPITATGSAASPEMNLQWFCHPSGVERFEISIAEERGKPSLSFAKASLNAKYKAVERLVSLESIVVKALFAAGFYTGRVGGEMGNGPLFAATAKIQSGRQYTVQVRSVTPAGVKSPWSQPAVFKWTHVTAKVSMPEPGAEEPCLPWPARGLPPVNPNAHPDLVARSFVDVNHELLGIRYPAGVRIAVAPTEGRLGTIGVGRFSATGISPLLVRRKDENQPVFPFVLYRFQIPNAAYPRVSGDLVQVSPLHEEMNYEFFIDNPPLVLDPFFARVSEDATFRGGRWDGIYVLDNHPVLSEAKYGYLLVCFHYNGELDQIIPTNPITMPYFDY